MTILQMNLYVNANVKSIDYFFAFMYKHDYSCNSIMPNKPSKVYTPQLDF